MAIVRSFVLALGGLALLLTTSGCGSGLIKANGKVLKDGKPLHVSGRILQVTFYADEVANAKPNEAFMGNLGPGSTFVVPGKSGKGIPPGKYRITVELMSPSDSDYLKGEFGLEKTPIIREVATSDEIIIDLDNPTG